MSALPCPGHHTLALSQHDMAHHKAATSLWTGMTPHLLVHRQPASAHMLLQVQTWAIASTLNYETTLARTNRTKSAA